MFPNRLSFLLTKEGRFHPGSRYYLRAIATNRNPIPSGTTANRRRQIKFIFPVRLIRIRGKKVNMMSRQSRQVLAIIRKCHPTNPFFISRVAPNNLTAQRINQNNFILVKSALEKNRPVIRRVNDRIPGFAQTIRSLKVVKIRTDFLGNIFVFISHSFLVITVCRISLLHINHFTVKIYLDILGRSAFFIAINSRIGVPLTNRPPFRINMTVKKLWIIGSFRQFGNNSAGRSIHFYLSPGKRNKSTKK